MKINFLAVGLLQLITVAGVFGQTQTISVLFVCEHGSAKSVVAAAHFTKLAKERGLNVRVESRGINPDALVPATINDHLISDGFEEHTAKPIQLTSADLQASDYVVAFNPIPAKYGQAKRIEQWNIPSFEAGYTVAKDSILTNIKRIIDKIDNQK